MVICKRIFGFLKHDFYIYALFEKGKVFKRWKSREINEVKRKLIIPFSFKSKKPSDWKAFHWSNY